MMLCGTCECFVISLSYEISCTLSRMISLAQYQEVNALLKQIFLDNVTTTNNMKISCAGTPAR